MLPITFTCGLGFVALQFLGLPGVEGAAQGTPGSDGRDAVGSELPEWVRDPRTVCIGKDMTFCC